ncbi:mitofusin [Cryptotrichosporon argae]
MQPFHVYHYPAPPGSPAYEKESQSDHGPSMHARIAGEEVVRGYEENRDTLSKAIEDSQYLLADLKNFNGEHWTVRYPHLRSSEPAEGSTQTYTRPSMSRRTLTFADEPATPTEVVFNTTPTARRTMKRSLTIAPGAAPAAPSTTTHDDDDFSILRLDLNMGAQRHAKTLISHLEKASISALLDTRITSSLDHLALLQTRIHDAHSRVLVTGDLNAGKSTLINALLRRNEVMPTDEQPLTTRFVEIVSAKENGGKEEIHVMKGEAYDQTDPSTYDVESIDKLEAMATDADIDASAPSLRVYLQEVDNSTNPSILHNGVVDISLIDAPGLNRDSIKTTANFARQEEIDVVVFVVSAANHFTLSAKEFIWQAGHEKAHLFIVVNRFDQIRDKERCRRAVLEQIKQLSPETYEDAKDLVHFVDSASVALGVDDDDDLDAAFAGLEQSLRSFVLVNRSRSKLGPAQTYVTHLLADVELLASANSIVAGRERDAAQAELARIRPVLEMMKKGQEGFEEGLVAEEESVTASASTRTKTAMERALERVGRGELAVQVPHICMPAFPGLLGVWDYAHDVRQALLASLEFASSLAEADARKLTADGVERVGQLGDAHFPADVQRTKRIFNPHAMFMRPSNRRRSSINPVGLGLAARPYLAEVTVSDIFDLQHHLFLARPSSSSSSRELIPLSLGAESLGAASLAVGAFSLVGGKALGLRTAVQSVVHMAELASSPAVRKWAAPVLGVAVVGAVAYVVYDLPRSVPRNIGRHLHAALATETGEADTDSDAAPWPVAQADRIGREVRKVMRLAAWDLRERFSGAVEARAEAIREAEAGERKAAKAIAWFDAVGARVDGIREQVVGIKI